MTKQSAPGVKKDSADEGFIEAIWGFFSSMKTAITLLLILAAGSVVGTVVPQVSMGATAEEISAKYGAVGYRLVHAVQLDSAYDSWWYLGLIVLIGINLAVCSLNRFKAVKRRVFHPQVVATEKQISGMQRVETLRTRMSVSEAGAAVETALRSSSYHVLGAEDAGDHVIYAAKGRLSFWGPYLTHLSILVIFIGAVVGAKLGFSGFTSIDEGRYTDQCYTRKGDAKPLGFKLALKDFTIGYDKAHNPTSYRSELEAVEGDQVVRKKTIDVNHPLTYKGISFYQSDFGLSEVVLKVTAPNGETKRLAFAVRKQQSDHGTQYVLVGASGDMAFEQFVLAGKRLTVFAHDLAPDYIGGEKVSLTDMPLNPAVRVMVNDRMPAYKGMDAWTDLGWIEESKSAGYKGYKIGVADVVDYTALQVARNPGLPVVYGGFGLMLIGVFVSFYVSRRSVRVRVTGGAEGVVALIGGNSRTDPDVFDTDFSRVREILK